MKKITVFTGAGVSAESGIQTFRDTGGLWHKHSIEDVATAEGFARNPKLVLDFYNERRLALPSHQPNAFHLFIAELEKTYQVNVFTQNIDDLHERGGSNHVAHLHGSLLEACTDEPGANVKKIGYDAISIGDTFDGKQYRPNVVFFGETPFGIDHAKFSASVSDWLIIAGTSLSVQPAASIAMKRYAPSLKKIYINPNTEVGFLTEWLPQVFDVCIEKKATEAVDDLRKILLQ